MAEVRGVCGSNGGNRIQASTALGTGAYALAASWFPSGRKY